MWVTKGSFTIIDIYESVQRVRFLMTPSPYSKAYSKMLIFFPVILGTSNMHRLRVGPTGTAYQYTPRIWSFHIFLYTIINTTIAIKKIYIYLLLKLNFT